MEQERVGAGTWFAIDRKIFSSDIWFDSPWKLKIFIYLLGHAAHKDGHFMGVPIKRGELIRSYRTIAKDCGYKVGYRLKKPSYDTVRRICEELTKALRIDQRTVHCGTLFKIINYDKFQPQKKHEPFTEPFDEPFNDRSMTVQYKNKEELETKKKDISSSGPETGASPPADDPGTPPSPKIQKRSQKQPPEIVRQVIDYLNEKTRSTFKPGTADTVRFISARSSEGHSLEDFKAVIDLKAGQWLNDPKMNGNLRPSTLFRPSNFEAYIQEVNRNGRGELFATATSILKFDGPEVCREWCGKNGIDFDQVVKNG